MEQYVLYMVVKDMLTSIDNGFKYTFNDMDSMKGNSTGIYIKGAEPSKYRTISDGKYFNIVNRVQLLIQGSLDNDSLMRCLRLGSKIKDALITSSNRYIVASQKLGLDNNGEIVIADSINNTQRVNVVLTKVDLISDLINLGKSEQGLPRYSINFKISYEIRG